MNIIEKTMASIKDWVEFYFDNSTLSESTKDKIKAFINSIIGEVKYEK